MSAPIRTVVAYGFKGGVGRTQALVSCAYLLARRGYSVVLADWDIHAPGLTCMPDLQDPDLAEPRRGVVDVLASLAQSEGKGEVLNPGYLIRPTKLGRRIQATVEGAAPVWLLPAGHFDPGGDNEAYARQVSDLSPQLRHLVDKAQGGLVAWFRDRIAEAFSTMKETVPDYLLFDARTGLTEVRDILFAPDKDGAGSVDNIVLVHGLNPQNLAGLDHTLRALVYAGADLPSKVVVVASPVPTGEEELKENALRKRADVLRGICGKDEALWPKVVSVPYHPRLALSDELLVERFPQSDPAWAYAELMGYLVPGSPDATKVEIQANLQRAGIEAGARDTQPAVVPEKGVARDPVPEESELLRAPHAEDSAARREHPLARRLPWNAVDPTADRARISDKLPADVLDDLANTLSLDLDERDRILEKVAEISPAQIRALLGIFDEERTKFRALEPNHWEQLARLIGQSWARWTVLVATRLGLSSEEAVGRVVDAWPHAPGSTWRRASMVGAADALLKEKLPVEATLLLRRLAEDTPQALRDVALRMVLAGDLSAARSALERARAPGEDPEALGEALYGAFRRIPSINKEGELLFLTEAETYLSKVPEDQRSPSTLVLLGNVLHAKAELLAPEAPAAAESAYLQAIQHYRTAMRDDDRPVLLSNAGNSSRLLAELLAPRDPTRARAVYEQAAAWLESAAKQNPKDKDIFLTWADVLHGHAALEPAERTERALELLDQARDHVEEALRLDPRSVSSASLGTRIEGRRYHLLTRLGRATDAASAAERAVYFAQRAGAVTGRLTYDFACALAISGRNDDALHALMRLAHDGKLSREQVERDDDFQGLRDDHRFPDVLRAIDEAALRRRSTG